MAEIENTVINRSAGILPTIVSLWPIVVGLIGGGSWLYHLEGTTAANTVAMSDLKDRVKSIEEGRSVGLQRLATVEEAVKGQNKILDAQSDTLKDISSKLDRVLMGGLRR